MPYDECDPEDPLEFMGMSFPAKDESTMLAMAECFVEEYLRMGWTEQDLMRVFKNPEFIGPYMVYEAKGEAFVLELIASMAGLRCPQSKQECPTQGAPR